MCSVGLPWLNRGTTKWLTSPIPINPRANHQSDTEDFKDIRPRSKAGHWSQLPPNIPLPRPIRHINFTGWIKSCPDFFGTVNYRWLISRSPKRHIRVCIISSLTHFENMWVLNLEFDLSQALIGSYKNHYYFSNSMCWQKLKCHWHWKWLNVHWQI